MHQALMDDVWISAILTLNNVTKIVTKCYDAININNDSDNGNDNGNNNNNNDTYEIQEYLPQQSLKVSMTSDGRLLRNSHKYFAFLFGVNRRETYNTATLQKFGKIWKPWEYGNLYRKCKSYIQGVVTNCRWAD